MPPLHRHNYETYFLLYVDNELSPAERKAVELFVSENPDLEAELIMFQQTKLPTENISYGFKNQLHKIPVTEEMRESMLLLADNELDPESAKALQSGISDNSALQEEWNILLQTKLDPNEQVTFRNKSVLYRHERGRILLIRPWRLAAAAAILIIMLFAGISLLKKGEVSKDLVKSEVNSSPNGSPHKIVLDKPADKKINDITLEHDRSYDDERINNVMPEKKRDIKKNDQYTTDKELVKEQPSLNKTPCEEKPALENINNKERNEKVTASVLQKNSNDVVIEKTPQDLAQQTVINKMTRPELPVIDQQQAAIPDSYSKETALNDSPENNDHILYVSEERVAKSKLGGLFKRVKRVIQRNTNIKTGNGFRIGGYEIALNK